MNRTRQQWRKAKSQYLFNGLTLAKVFRARMLEALYEAGLQVSGLPEVVPSQSVGSGISTLKYLSKYLYLGLISEKKILSDQNRKIAFRYIKSKSGQSKTLALLGADFLWLVIPHVLPKDFRRVRDHGFSHSNVKRLL
ncbi:hypothetical protein GL2_19240 [Microbulbifer sp. GL-2]|nr:hypothetical protein GL2_19240 [Microbulbifer sp. GL-2]